jgi:hypothetical protein
LGWVSLARASRPRRKADAAALAHARLDAVLALELSQELVLTAAKSPGASWSSAARRSRCSAVSLSASPFSASTTNIASRCSARNGRNLTLKVKRRSAASSSSSNRLVVQMNRPPKRSMPCSISLTSVTS